MLYFDTSALSPLFVPDVHTEAVYRYLTPRAGPSALSNLTMIELASMVSRSFPAHRIGENDAQDALIKAAQWTAQTCERLELEPEDYIIGEEFVRRFDLGLRAPDALHVAICRRLGLTLLTCDAAQAKAARSLGVEATNLSDRSA